MGSGQLTLWIAAHNSTSSSRVIKSMIRTVMWLLFQTGMHWSARISQRWTLVFTHMLGRPQAVQCVEWYSSMWREHDQGGVWGFCCNYKPHDHDDWQWARRWSVWRLRELTFLVAILSCHSVVHKQWRESLWRSRAQFVTFIFVTGFAGGKCLAAREVMKELSSKPCQRGRWQMNGSHIFNAVIDTGKNETWDGQLVYASTSLDRLLELRVMEGWKKNVLSGAL